MMLRHWYFPPDQNLSAQPNKKKPKTTKQKEESTVSNQKLSFGAERIPPILKACLLGKALGDFICCEAWRVRVQPANRQSETASEASSVCQRLLCCKHAMLPATWCYSGCAEVSPRRQRGAFHWVVSYFHWRSGFGTKYVWWMKPKIPWSSLRVF